MRTLALKYQGSGLNKGIADQIRAENPTGMSAYDLSYRLTQLCQDEKLSDTTRAKIEYLAGEVILCFDQIREGLVETETVKRRQKQQGVRRYVSLS